MYWPMLYTSSSESATTAKSLAIAPAGIGLGTALHEVPVALSWTSGRGTDASFRRFPLAQEVSEFRTGCV